ncbi:MAG: hypothetical protein LBV69_03270 [Bacteroidales bacterium]|jgi:hypothetical protein|nr:hypothetical protein [Bacteroidales bacterium]
MLNKVFNLLLIFLVIFLCSCTNSTGIRNIKDDFEEVEFLPQEYDVDSLFSIIPTYNQISEEINKNIFVFKKEGLLPIEKSSLYENSQQIALVLGMYTVDLGYARHFERVQLCSDYLDEMRILLNKIAINDNDFNKFVPILEQNLEDNETLLQIIDSLINVGNKFLSGKETAGLNILFLSGFWIETIYIGLLNNVNLQEIDYQYVILDGIIKLLDYLKDPKIISPLKNDLKKISKNKNTNLKEISKIRKKFLILD